MKSLIATLAAFAMAGCVSVPPAPKTLAERLGYPATARLLIVHADDLGMAHSVNAATTRALGTGLVNSASIMVPCPQFEEIAAWAREHPDADLGLHLTLTSEWKTLRWGPVSGRAAVPSLVDTNGFFLPTEMAASERATLRDAEIEVRAQIEKALASGIRPTHLDNHMRTLHMTAPLFGLLLRVSREYNLPAAVPASFLSRPDYAALLGPGDVVIDRFVTIGPEVPAEGWGGYYTDVVRKLEPGVTELIVHLAWDDEEMRAITLDHPNWGAAWRQRDFDFLTSDRFRSVLDENRVKLVTWREIARKLKN